MREGGPFAQSRVYALQHRWFHRKAAERVRGTSYQALVARHFTPVLLSLEPPKKQHIAHHHHLLPTVERREEKRRAEKAGGIPYAPLP